jgi:enoyl-CoA hydratase/carnithine racemase
MASVAPNYSEIIYQVEDGIATITLNRPEKLNAFTYVMMTELIDAFDQVDADDDVRAVIVTGAGRAFCAGADLAAGGDTFSDGKLSTESSSKFRRDGGGTVTLRMFKCNKPIIGALNGAGVGIGVTMTLPMDIRIAADTAKFGFVFTVFSAAEALAGGLVRSIHPADELMNVARGLAREIADNAAPVSVALSRQMMWRMLGASHPMEAHRVDSRGIQIRGRSEDVREGVTSFLEKRPAQFTGKVSTDLPDIFPGWDEPEFF